MKNPNADKLIATYLYHNEPLPKGLENKPVLFDIESGIYSAFWELSTDRLDGLRPIPWSSIQRYSRHIGMDADIFCNLIRHMDDVYLAHQSEKQEKGK